MIALLRGVLLEKHPNQVIVEAGGVGYDVTVPVSTFTRLPDTGAEIRLRIYTHVREDTLALRCVVAEVVKAERPRMKRKTSFNGKPRDSFGH